jgi:hypothetical protein
MTEEYRRGYLAAMRDFAWWRGGAQYVGCGVYTLKEAERQLKERCDGIKKLSEFKIPEGDMPECSTYYDPGPSPRPCGPGRIG